MRDSERTDLQGCCLTCEGSGTYIDDDGWPVGCPDCGGTGRGRRNPNAIPIETYDVVSPRDPFFYTVKRAIELHRSGDRSPVHISHPSEIERSLSTESDQS